MLPLRIVVALLLLGGTAAAEGPKRVLLVTHAGGYMHDSGLVAERFRRVRVLIGGLPFWRLGSMPCWKRYPLPISPEIRGATQVGPESSSTGATPTSVSCCLAAHVGGDTAPPITAWCLDQPRVVSPEPNN
jgi:hypothetical protein